MLYKALWFYKNVLWNWYHQHARVFDWQHICYVWWTCFPKESRHIHMGTNCAPLLIDLLLYSFEADVIQEHLKKSYSGHLISRSAIQTMSFYWISLRLVICWSHLSQVEIKDTTDTSRAVSYLGLHPEIDNEEWLRTKLYDKRLFRFSHCEISIYM